MNRRTMVRGLLVVTAGMLLACHGCGRGSQAAANDLKEVGIMYHQYLDKSGGAGPTKAEDLQPFAADYPQGYQGLKDGKYVFIWNAKRPLEASKTVLGYEKDVPTKGGFVLMGDSSVKPMTADEFKAAPKAK